jgi:peptide/nickel transport system substrate-binding protein
VDHHAGCGTGASALQSGEQDWQETTPHDMLPLLRRNRNIEVDVLDPLGFTCLMRVNHLQPPFNNPPSAARCWAPSTRRPS